MRSLQPFVAHGSGVSTLSIGSKSAAVLATGSLDMDINVWRVGRPSALVSMRLGLRHMGQYVSALDFDPQEEFLAAGSSTGVLKIFDLGAG